MNASRPVDPDAGASAPPLPRIDSRAAWRQAVLWGFETAIARGARCITCIDADFAEWPLDDAALLQRLTTWLRLPQRRLHWLAAGYEPMARLHPRLLAWRADWVHASPGWQISEDQAAALPSLLLDDTGLSLQLIDAVHWRGRAALDRRSATLWQERLDAWMQRAEPSFAAKTLGI